MQAQTFRTLYSKLVQVQQECVKRKQSDDGCLMTLGLLPGSGKTFGITKFISQRLVADPGFRAVYITNQNKNLRPENFYTQISQAYVRKHGSFLNEDERKRYLTHHVVVLCSLPDSVKHLLNRPLPSEFTTDEIAVTKSKLEKAYKTYLTISKIATQDGQSYQKLATAELNFRRAVWNQLATAIKMPLPLTSHDLRRLKAKTLAQKSETIDWLRDCFPTVNLESAQLIITNTSKAIRTYHPFFSTKTRPVCDPQTTLKKAFIVLDELDSMKSVITQTIIDNAYRLPVDFLRLFKRLHQELNV